MSMAYAQVARHPSFIIKTLPLVLLTVVNNISLEVVKFVKMAINWDTTHVNCLIVWSPVTENVSNATLIILWEPRQILVLTKMNSVTSTILRANASSVHPNISCQSSKINVFRDNQVVFMTILINVQSVQLHSNQLSGKINVTLQAVWSILLKVVNNVSILLKWMKTNHVLLKTV